MFLGMNIHANFTMVRNPRTSAFSNELAALLVEYGFNYYIAPDGTCEAYRTPKFSVYVEESGVLNISNYEGDHWTARFEGAPFAIIRKFLLDNGAKRKGARP